MRTDELKVNLGGASKVAIEVTCDETVSAEVVQALLAALAPFKEAKGQKPCEGCGG